MLAVELEEAEPGMKLGVAVTHPEKPAHELLKAGFTLDQPAINELRALAVGTIYVQYPGLEELDQYFAVHLSSARQAVYQQIKATIAQVQQFERPVAAFHTYYQTTRDLITTLLDSTRHPCHVEMLCNGRGDAVTHATTVAQLALTLGLRMEQYLIEQRSRLPANQAKQVVNLGVAGMLHDLGKVKLSEPLQGYTDISPPQDPAEREQWEAHPRISYDLIHDDVEATAASAVLHHHQHFDGSGFPKGANESAPPAGDKIHVFARILQAADLYDRLAQAPDGRRRPGIEVLHLMRVKYANWLDPQVLSAFPTVVPPFAPGAKVRLSDGTDAVVMGPCPADPYRPAVRRMEGPEKRPGPPVPLSAPGAPSIVSVNGVSVTRMVGAMGLAA